MERHALSLSVFPIERKKYVRMFSGCYVAYLTIIQTVTGDDFERFIKTFPKYKLKFQNLHL